MICWLICLLICLPLFDLLFVHFYLHVVHRCCCSYLMKQLLLLFFLLGRSKRLPKFLKPCFCFLWEWLLFAVPTVVLSVSDTLRACSSQLEWFGTTTVCSDGIGRPTSSFCLAFGFRRTCPYFFFWRKEVLNAPCLEHDLRLRDSCPVFFSTCYLTLLHFLSLGKGLGFKS